MVTRLLHRRISRIAACLAALMLTLPVPVAPVCGCSLDNLSGEHSERPRAEESSSVRNACCDSHGTATIKSACCDLRDSERPSCCSSVLSGRTSAQRSDGSCNCGPSCACSQDQVPDPPTGPVNQTSATGEQAAAASATSLPAQGDAGGSQMERRQGCTGGPATSLERCILLSCFAL